MESSETDCNKEQNGKYNFADLPMECRTTDGPSDEELKKITRICMRKVMGNDNNNQKNNDYDEDKNDGHNDDYYESDGNNNEPFRLRNRDHLQGRTVNNRPRRLSTAQMSNNYDLNRQQHQQQQQQQYNSNTNNNRRYNVMTSSNQRNGNNSTSPMMMERGKDRRNQNNNDQQSCIVHCFFGELNTLNDDGFPDKHKVLHILTRDIREHELRDFYVDTIRDCFGHLNQEYRKDKCQFSKSLINCMAEYARANCEDWYEHTAIFN